MFEDLILLLQELADLPDQVSNLIADPLVAKILKHPALTQTNKAQLLSAIDRENDWLFVGLDFASLEDRISALTTKDPNKLTVYLEGFDGHSLRAQAYFGEAMLDIERAPEGAKCYRAMLGDKTIYFHEQEQIVYMGTKLTGAELYQLLQEN